MKKYGMQLSNGELTRYKISKYDPSIGDCKYILTDNLNYPIWTVDTLLQLQKVLTLNHLMPDYANSQVQPDFGKLKGQDFIPVEIETKINPVPLEPIKHIDWKLIKHKREVPFSIALHYSSKELVKKQYTLVLLKCAKEEMIKYIGKQIALDFYNIKFVYDVIDVPDTSLESNYDLESSCILIIGTD